MVRRLELLGATPFVLPAVEIGPARGLGAGDRAINELTRYQVAGFHQQPMASTPPGAIADVRARPARPGEDCAWPHWAEHCCWPCAPYHLEPDVVPKEFASEDSWRRCGKGVAGQSVLLARADRRPRGACVRSWQVARVEQVAVYSQKDGRGQQRPPRSTVSAEEKSNT